MGDGDGSSRDATKNMSNTRLCTTFCELLIYKLGM